MSKQITVEIRDLTVEFRNHVKAVNGISLNIPTGIYGLLGENGAGKTTLMRVLTTILDPTEGEVTLDGIPYAESNYNAIRRKIGYLPQELNLYPSLSVRECLEYLGDMYGLTKAQKRERIDYYLERTSLSEHQHKKIKQLSGGMKRRVGLIQALIHDPKFLVIDEPTTGLDPEERIRIRNLLVEFSSDRTVLFSTHVVEDLAATCNQLAVMKKGRLLYGGSVRRLMEYAEGHVWLCKVQENQVRELENKYCISSKQFTPEGMAVKIISDYQPEIPCQQVQTTLEDAYILVSNKAGKKKKS